jgi:hypothetical protein
MFGRFADSLSKHSWILQRIFEGWVEVSSKCSTQTAVHTSTLADQGSVSQTNEMQGDICESRPFLQLIQRHRHGINSTLWMAILEYDT